MPFVYRDKLFSCVSNYAYGQSQRAMGSLPNKTVAAAPIVSGGGSADLIKIARKWLQLEDRVREQIQRIDDEVEGIWAEREKEKYNGERMDVEVENSKTNEPSAQGKWAFNPEAG